MSSLREIKDRIASVRSTLKITSAMKLVASSKLRKAQRAIEAMRPYEETLSQILAVVSASQGMSPESSSWEAVGNKTAAFVPEKGENVRNWNKTDGFVPAPTVVLAFSSNSSMCGAFNSNVIKRTLEVLRETTGPVETWAFGRKMLEALRKSEYPAARDCSHLVAHPSFDGIAELSRDLRSRYEAGEISGAVLIYNHFVSTGRQQVVVEDYFQSSCGLASPGSSQDDYGLRPIPPTASGPQPDSDELYILEPSRVELLESLMPQVLELKLYAALLDSAASEHAARMIAMQAATDNAESLLKEITLEYNKGRQQKITSEILDLVSGEA